MLLPLPVNESLVASDVKPVPVMSQGSAGVPAPVTLTCTPGSLLRADATLEAVELKSMAPVVSVAFLTVAAMVKVPPLALFESCSCTKGTN